MKTRSRKKYSQPPMSPEQKMAMQSLNKLHETALIGGAFFSCGQSAVQILTEAHGFTQDDAQEFATTMINYAAATLKYRMDEYGEIIADDYEQPRQSE